MDETFTDGELVEQFVEIVAMASLKAQVEGGLLLSPTEEELEHMIETSLIKMSAIYKAGHFFDQEKYIDEMARQLLEAKRTGEDLWPIFSRFCSFLVALEMAKDLPSLVKKFKELRWWEWTGGHIDLKAFKNVTFLGFAYQIIDAAARELEKDDGLDFDVAQAVQHVALAFKIQLPEKLGECIYFQLCDDPGEYRAAKCDHLDNPTGWMQ